MQRYSLFLVIDIHHVSWKRMYSDIIINKHNIVSKINWSITLICSRSYPNIFRNVKPLKSKPLLQTHKMQASNQVNIQILGWITIDRAFHHPPSSYFVYIKTLQLQLYLYLIFALHLIEHSSAPTSLIEIFHHRNDKSKIYCLEHKRERKRILKLPRRFNWFI